MTEIFHWLETIGLSRYYSIFTENEIDFEVLPELTEPDLRELGLPMGPRKKLLKAIAALSSEDNAANNQPDGNKVNVDQTSTPLTPPQINTPQHLADKILSSRSVMEGERKQVTILFADIKGSTQLVDGIDPEKAAMLMDPVLQTMMEAVHRYEGTVNRMQGDGLMAMFGAPIAHEDHALRACLAALDMQNAIQHNINHSKQQTIELQTRVGLNSGEVVVRSINNDLSMNYDAVGVTAHLAARMEQMAPPNGIYITGHTLHLAEGMIAVNPQGAMAVKGLADPVEVFELTGSTARTRWQASLARGLSHFVGRALALQQLGETLKLSGSGQGQLVTIMGEAGMGKSRLIHEFICSPVVQRWQILAGSSVSYGKASEWLPVIDLCKAYFHLHESDDVATKIEKIQTQLATLDSDFKKDVPVFLALLDIPHKDESLAALGAKQQRRKTLETLQTLFIRESQRQPLILIFEDLHWIDGETQALLNELVERLPGNQLLLLTNFRPEYRHTWSNLSYYTYLRLDPLAQENTAELLDTLLGDDGKLSQLKHHLIAHSAGNPLFIEESVRSMLETGFIGGERGNYQQTGKLDELKLPSTVQAVIAERIDRLGLLEKQILQTAAVIGSNLPLAVLKTVSGENNNDLQTTLSKLQSVEFLFISQSFPELEYRFKHAHTHQVAYSGLLREQRRHLHAKVAETIVTLYPDRQHELAEKLAEHYELGEVDDQAISYYLLSATKSRSKYTYPSAISYAKKALELAQKSDEHREQQVKTLTLLGDLSSLQGEIDQANSYYKQALPLTYTKDVIQTIYNRIHHRRFAIRDGAQIAYYEHGSGDITLLLMSPTAYHPALFQPVVETLCQQFRVITIDPRGTGFSDVAPPKYLSFQHIEDTRAVIEAIECGSVVAVGLSAGGRQAAWLYHKFPKLVEKLVFIGTPPSHGCSERELASQWQLLSQGDFSQFDQFINDFANNLFSESEARDFADDYIRIAKELPKSVWQNFANPEAGDSIRPIYKQLKVPVLVLHGGIDHQVPLKYSEEIAEQIPGAQLRIFDNNGHLLLFTAAQEFCEVLSEFAISGKISQDRVISYQQNNSPS